MPNFAIATPHMSVWRNHLRTLREVDVGNPHELPPRPPVEKPVEMPTEIPPGLPPELPDESPQETPVRETPPGISEPPPETPAR